MFNLVHGTWGALAPQHPNSGHPCLLPSIIRYHIDRRRIGTQHTVES